MMEKSEQEISGIFCIIDLDIAGLLDQLLEESGLQEVYIQRAKQMSLASRLRTPFMRPVTVLSESRALIYRMYVPSEYEEGLMAKIAETADLKMGGRGSIFSQKLKIQRGEPFSFDYEKLENLCGRQDKNHSDESVLISCIVSRGSGASIARAMLEIGLCVPVIFFGSGMGFREKLGLLRIAIPVEKEIIWFIVPKNDAVLAEKFLIPKAHSDIRGQGYIYQSNIHAPAVNLRIRESRRIYAASMEQVINAIDEVRGSSDWRRLGAHDDRRSLKQAETRGFFFMGSEEEVDIFRRTALDNGAGGATVSPLQMQAYGEEPGQANESRSRQLCEIIITPGTEEKLEKAVRKTGLLDDGKTCILKTFNTQTPEAGKN
ncbi:MAG: hypothetical protein FWF22_02775 [Treponema sp.]|nr:hypothetical protein [Treponema sp.]